MGRQVIGNLTMASSSTRDFTITMLGHHLANLLAEEDPAASRLEAFIRWEQLAAHVRAHEHGATGFRGSERVEKTLRDGTRIVLSAERRFQILASQKMYGLWGLYTVPARNSGLIHGDPAVPTDGAKGHLDQSLRRVAGARTDRLLERILAILRPARCTVDLAGDGAALSRQIGALIPNRLHPSEAGFYEDHLARGGPDDSTGGCQPRLAELLSRTVRDPRFHWSPTMVGELAKRADAHGAAWGDLATMLRRIETCAGVLNAAARIFRHLMTCDGVLASRVASDHARHFGGGLRTIDARHFEEILDDSAIGIGPDAAQRWREIASTLSAGDYLQSTHALIRHNAGVMAMRGGQPWITVERDRLRVFMSEEGADLPSERELRDAWEFPFFLDSLRQVVIVVEEARRG